MATATDISNLALNIVGAEGVLATLDDQTKEGRVCKNNYDLSRQAVLRSHPWNFAIARASLSLLTVAPVFGYANAFQLPVDCLRALSVDDTDKVFRIEGRTLVTDESQVDLRYVRDEQDTSKFDALFVQVLAQHLAWRIAYTITQSNDRVVEIGKQLDEIMPKARFVDATEDSVTQLVADEYTNARIGPNRGFVRDPQT